MIKAIETVYNGYRFRSRLEARWAVFFDKLGIKYEYEYEGFVLPNGKCYLPDFWLSDLEYFAEVKGKDPTIEEQKKIAALTEDNSKHLGLILRGTPNFIDNEGYDFWLGKFIGFGAFIECTNCGQIGRITRHPLANIIGFRLRCDCRKIDPEHATANTDTPRIIAAYNCARQARFDKR